MYVRACLSICVSVSVRESEIESPHATTAIHILKLTYQQITLRNHVFHRRVDTDPFNCIRDMWQVPFLVSEAVSVF